MKSKVLILACRRSGTSTLRLMMTTLMLLSSSTSSSVTCYTPQHHPHLIQVQRPRRPTLPSKHIQRFGRRHTPSLWSESESSESSPGAPYDVEVEDEHDDDFGKTAAVVVDLDPMAVELKDDIRDLAQRTKRGFQASSKDRQRAKELITGLSKYNPTSNPASPYYDNAAVSSSTSTKATLSGKWTLIYTDAPDITGLDTSNNPFATAVLGRIGQECIPPYIKNVIEWKRPTWATNLPFSGRPSSTDGDEPRILQKVVTSASSNPNKDPFKVDLKVAGFELTTAFDDNVVDSSSSSSKGNAGIASRIDTLGLLPGLLSWNPIDIKGPVNPPFGQFEILYLDDDFRMIRTYQGYYAINQRITSAEDEWF